MPPKQNHHKFLLHQLVTPTTLKTGPAYRCMVCKLAGEPIPKAKAGRRAERDNDDDDDDDVVVIDSDDELDADGVDKTKSLFDHTKYTYASADKFLSIKSPGTVHTHMKTHRLCDDAGVYDDDMLETWDKKYAPTAVRTGPIDGWVMNTAEMIIDVIAENKLSFNQIQSASWRRLIRKVAPELKANRRSIRDKMSKRCDDLLDAYLKDQSGKFVHISADGGTKIHRYVIIVLHSAEKNPIIFDLLDERHLTTGYNNNTNTPDDDDDDRDEPIPVPLRHTSENLAACFNRICNFLYERKICVGSITTDNCAAFVGAVERVQFGVIPGRCVCHGLCLLVKLLCQHHPGVADVIELADEFYKDVVANNLVKALKIERFIDSRWSSRYNNINSIYKCHVENPHVMTEHKMADKIFKTKDRQSFEKTLPILKYFLKAIRIAEADNANQIHSLHALSVCLFHKTDYGLETWTHLRSVDKEAVEEVAALFDRKVQDRLLSAPLVITAYVSCAWDFGSLAEISQINFSALREKMEFWLSKSAFVKRIVAFHVHCHPGAGYSIAMLTEQFKHFNDADKSALIEHNTKMLTEQTFNNVLDFMTQNDWHLLRHVVTVIKDTPSSEASSERGFSAVDRTVPPPRSSLKPATVAMQTKYASLRSVVDSASIALNEQKEKKRAEDNDAELFKDFRPAPRKKARDIGEDEAENVAKTASAVIDLAIEKAHQNKRSFNAKRVEPNKYCAGKPGGGGKTSCNGFRLDTAGSFLVLCPGTCGTGGAGATRCNHCWGFPAAAEAEYDRSKFKCQACRAFDYDDWFDRRMEEETEDRIDDDNAGRVY